MSTTEALNPQALPVKDNVALRIIQTTPAIVKFNYEEIEANLDAVLVKYQGLVFTESAAADCKKTIAELRKGQKALSDFRIATKKDLTASVTAFENQCKVITEKFEKVIQPLTTQNDQFELDRKEAKRVEVQSVIDSLITENGLTGNYALRLIILEEYYNKGKTIKTIKAELSALAKTAKLQQDKDEQDCAFIKAKVELANAQYQLTNTLLPDQYLRLLAYRSVAEVDALITSDAIEISERERKVAEADFKTAEKYAEALIAKAADAPGCVNPVGCRGAKPYTSSAVNVESEAPATFQSYTAQVVIIKAVYEVKGTEAQLEALEEYLDAQKLSWIDRPNG
ncbi:DUF1351 domain-containing protein [Desulfosporosinus fructosivorans]|uniref:DUF1351 domain-containing protein n=1 Tax=Desulfosporosinus fructosivorans TaxID=2018669 RepID=A0A4Z0R4D7_9FIRM|nr:DUF1351 domain-containing protein [Desulfosporosinus fructosivorans]TGE36867.1 DUF1351 domain-containing protein [Desulfosporosinus fructosivorans]